MIEVPQSLPEPLKLTPNDLHIWLAHTDIEIPTELATAYREMLNEEEKARQDRFIFEKHRHSFLIAHAFLRAVLSRYHDAAPKEWSFVKNQFGRPDLVIPEGCPPLVFNLSHTNGLAVCAVTLNRDLGVDVEDMERDGATVSLAHRYFSKAELTALKALPSELQRHRFFELWTLKESYMKARGIGLSLGLGNFSFCLKDPKRISISFSDAIDDRPDAWQFDIFDPFPRYRVAYAIKREPGRKVEVQTRLIRALLGESLHDENHYLSALKR